MARHRTKTEHRLQNSLSTRSLSSSMLNLKFPESLKQHPESQSHFKKTSLALKFLQEFGEGKRWYLCQDETRLGLKTIAGRLLQQALNPWA